MEPLGYIIAIIIALCAGMMIAHDSDECYIAELEDKIESYENGGAESANYERSEDRILQIRQNK